MIIWTISQVQAGPDVKWKTINSEFETVPNISSASFSTSCSVWTNFSIAWFDEKCSYHGSITLTLAPNPWSSTRSVRTNMRTPLKYAKFSNQTLCENGGNLKEQKIYWRLWPWFLHFLYYFSFQCFRVLLLFILICL